MTYSKAPLFVALAAALAIVAFNWKVFGQILM
jgi:hypothetical protein